VNLRFPWLWQVGAASFVIVGVGCHESSGAKPTSVELTPSAAAALPPPVTRTPSAESPPQASASAAPPAPPAPTVSAAVPNAGPSASSESPTTREYDAAPQLFDEQGKPLGQTEQRPTLTSASFQQRVEAVARAIISGDVEPALPAFFPLVAYQQVKDVAKPERDYKFRLLANFKRDLLEYHHALGAAAAESKFAGITVAEKDAKWMAPGSEGNKLGYFRVLRSRLRFTLPTGRSREFELTSLISWRGEWYVVHLHGFK